MTCHGLAHLLVLSLPDLHCFNLAARGHIELVQLILETLVMTDGPDKAKRNVIDHANAKRQTALMVACKHGYANTAAIFHFSFANAAGSRLVRVLARLCRA